ncbi:hypothetical protein [Mesobacillus subterraneus]|uniref:hypothetical protein n=1 Tax=Mesobacillus subterraneus TaxID=285983 RepID=UPI001CFCD959|nr:hypothetical protein [Mesobacillus subterraneus]
MKKVFELHSHTNDSHQYNTEKKSYLVIQPASFVEADLLLSNKLVRKALTQYNSYFTGNDNLDLCVKNKELKVM